MRIGQISFVYFLSKITVSVIGAVATLYFARELGASIFGVYSLVLALVSWLKLAGEMGIGGALSKRISEGNEPNAYIVTGAIVIGAFTAVMLVGIGVFSPWIVSYIGHPDAPIFLAALVVVNLLYGYTTAVLKGQRLVQLVAGISTTQTVIRVTLQIAAVVVGYQLLGLITGLIAGMMLASILGVVIVIRSLEDRPSPREWSYRHVKSLVSYAKFSWLGGVRGRSFSWIDIIVLGLFVPSNLIGVYSIAWNIASFLSIFGTSIRTSVFPEISKIAADDNTERVSNLITDVLSFGGLILIPGFIGGILIGEHLLRIYGSEFVQGSTVLGLLILAVLIYDYQMQFTNALNAINRPDLSFRVNVIFIGGNAVLNVGLIYLYGWIGAAIATVCSTIIGLIGAVYYLRREIKFRVPFREITMQWIAAILMGGVVYATLQINEMYQLFIRNIVAVLTIAGLGASVYFVLLFAISPQFRTVVRNNSPVEIPFS